MKIQKAVSVAVFAAATICSTAQDSTSNDLWDLSQGNVITRTSGVILFAGSPGGFFGKNGQDFFPEETYSYFSDGRPPGFVHFLEWETPADITLNHVRLFAVGDGPAFNNQREFGQFRLKTKSTGSSTFDVTILAFTPTHPYTFVDPSTYLLLDAAVPSISGRQFRAEFVQYTSGTGLDGARIREIDGFGTLGPVLPNIQTQPQSAEVNVGTPVVFRVDASGTGAVNYKWSKDGVEIPGATSATLTIDPVGVSDGGSYSVMITDDVGSVSSSAAALVVNTLRILPSSFDLWDVTSGTSIASASGFLFAGTPAGMFGFNGQDIFNESAYTYFSDGAPDGFTHFVEWTTLNPVTIRAIRLFAVGDGPEFNNQREFTSFTLKTKSPGSPTFDVTVGTFVPTHPYEHLDASTWALLDSGTAEIAGQEFRAEFVQFNGGRGFDGPRIMELDAFATVPEIMPAILEQPTAATVVHNSPQTFEVVAKGGNLQYQWNFNGAPIEGATSPAHTIDKVKPKHEGAYSVSIFNSLGEVTSQTVPLIVAVGEPE